MSVHRGSGAEQLAPPLRALLTEAANRQPYVLTLHMHLLLKMLHGIDVTDEDIAAYFTPTQRRLMKQQRVEANERTATLLRDTAKVGAR